MRTKFIALMGLSGAGKSYFKKQSVKAISGIKPLIAVTTRPPREEEQHKIDKYFIPENSFYHAVPSGMISFQQEIYGAKYGFYQRDLNREGVFIVELFYADYKEFKEKYPETIFILIKARDEKRRRKMLAFRSDAEARIRQDEKIQKVLEGMEQRGCFPYVFENSYDDQSSKQFLEWIDTINDGRR